MKPCLIVVVCFIASTLAAPLSQNELSNIELDMSETKVEEAKVESAPTKAKVEEPKAEELKIEEQKFDGSKDSKAEEDGESSGDGAENKAKEAETDVSKPKETKKEEPKVDETETLIEVKVGEPHPTKETKAESSKPASTTAAPVPAAPEGRSLGRGSRKYKDTLILENENEVNYDGSYHYSWADDSGSKANQEGQPKKVDEERVGNIVKGGFSYTDDDGNDFSVTYTADENGYRPVGNHLPVAPEIPPAIARALEYLATAKPWVDPSVYPAKSSKSGRKLDTEAKEEKKPTAVKKPEEAVKLAEEVKSKPSSEARKPAVTESSTAAGVKEKDETTETSTETEVPQ